MLLNKNSSFRYCLFSISNLFAAFGGGLILGKGVSIINIPYLQGGSILAFFIGTILGLGCLQCIPEKSSKLLAKFFSISCGVTSIVLFYIYQYYAYNGKISGFPAFAFFLLLSIRFGFWFYSRVMRASIASGHQQSIAWVEFGYYIGMVLGLVIWKLLDINIELGTALIIDAIFQLAAGMLDLRNFTLDKTVLDASQQEMPLIPELQSVQYNAEWCWKLAGAVIFFTIGVQVVIFNAAHYVAEVIGSYMLATFYFGVATAAFICNKYKIYISWENDNSSATISTNNTKKTIKCNLLLLVFILALSVIVVIPTRNLNNLMTNNIFFNDYFVYTFVFASAFIYEIISLSLLDRIGYEEKKSGGSGMIMRTYGLMGLGSAIGFWTLGLMNDHITSSLITLAICFSFATVPVLKKNYSKFGINQLKIL